MLIMFLSVSCLSLIMANSLALNFTVICMVDESSLKHNFTFINNVKMGSGEKATELQPLFNEQQQSLLFSAIAIGTILGTLPISYVSTHFGVRQI